MLWRNWIKIKRVSDEGIINKGGKKMTAPEKPDYKKKNYIFDKENRCWAVEDETAYSRPYYI